LQRLWSPWRLAYVTGASEPQGCIFCRPCDDGEQARLIVARGRHAYVIINLYPYNSGHLMVVPTRHVPSLAATTAEERAEMMELTRRAEMALQEIYAPHGLNVGINLGRAAGAGVIDHLHIHLVPRWNGDTNFMTTVGDVRVLPETLEQTVDRLRPVFDRLAREAGP